MTKNSVATGIDRRTLISGMTAVSALGGALSTVARAQTTVSSGTFSFAVCGDSRPMMYLPNNHCEHWSHPNPSRPKAVRPASR
jgi:hypothetical protein